MSSVTRFIRQGFANNQYYSAAAVAATPATHVYEFNSTSGNGNVNYPPGFMSLCSPALSTAIAQHVNAAGVGGAANLLLRDMGKTIRAPVTSLTGDVGYFRQVQLVNPSAMTPAQNFAGGSAGNRFGVLGAPATPDALTNYLVFYVPIAVAGVSAVPTVVALFPACGQM
jgi:hypothetical protein